MFTFTSPQDRNREVCLRTKMTRAPCRRRTGEAVPRAEKFGDLTTPDHNVLSEEGESRNNHRYAVVNEDLATSHETERILPKFLEPSHKPKVVYADNSSEFGKACEVLSGTTSPQHLIDQRQMASLREPFDE